MPRVKSSDLPPYARPTSKCWNVPGLQVEDKTEEFEASPKGGGDKVKLTASYKQVTFPDMGVATEFFGNIPTLLKELAESVNSWLQIQAKNAVKQSALGFENRVADAIKVAIANFTKDRGVEPTEAQTKVISDRVRAKLVKLAELEKEAGDFSDL